MKETKNSWKLKGEIVATDLFLYCKTYFSLNMFQSSIPQTGHLTHSSTSDQRPVNQNAKYYRQQLELLMMGIMVPEMC